MRNRNPFAVVALTIITFGIYGIVWSVKTKNEMNKLGAAIPTAWLIIIPFVSIWWLWKYSEGVEKVTNGKVSTILSFVLLFLVGAIGAAILQYEFNKGDEQSAAATPPAFGQAAPGFGAPAASFAAPAPEETLAAAPAEPIEAPMPVTPPQPSMMQDDDPIDPMPPVPAPVTPTPPTPVAPPTSPTPSTPPTTAQDDPLNRPPQV